MKKNLLIFLKKPWVVIVIVVIVFLALFLISNHLSLENSKKVVSVTKTEIGPRTLSVSGVGYILVCLSKSGWTAPNDLGPCDTVHMGKETFWMVRIDGQYTESPYLRMYRTIGNKFDESRYAEFLDIYWKEKQHGWISAGSEEKTRQYWPAIRKYGKMLGLDQFNPYWW